MPSRRGVWGMACWNGLSADQQRRLIAWGNLPFGYRPLGWCPNGAEVEVPWQAGDEAPGPRFYCRGCAPRNDLPLPSTGCTVST